MGGSDNIAWLEETWLEFSNVKFPKLQLWQLCWAIAVFRERNKSYHGLLCNNCWQNGGLHRYPCASADAVVSDGSWWISWIGSKRSTLGQYHWMFPDFLNLIIAKLQNDIAAAAVEALTAVHGTAYRYGSIIETLYAASGSSWRICVTFRSFSFYQSSRQQPRSCLRIFQNASRLYLRGKSRCRPAIKIHSAAGSNSTECGRDARLVDGFRRQS